MWWMRGIESSWQAWIEYGTCVLILGKIVFDIVGQNTIYGSSKVGRFICSVNVLPSFVGDINLDK